MFIHYFHFCFLCFLSRSLSFLHSYKLRSRRMSQDPTCNTPGPSNTISFIHSGRLTSALPFILILAYPHKIMRAVKTPPPKQPSQAHVLTSALQSFFLATSHLLDFAIYSFIYGPPLPIFYDIKIIKGWRCSLVLGLGICSIFHLFLERCNAFIYLRSSM